MKRFRTRVTALLLAACMLLGLTACGGKNGSGDGDKKGDKGQQLTGTVFTPEFKDITMDQKGVSLESVSAFVAVGEDFFFVGDIQETKPAQEAPAEGEDVPVGEDYNWRSGIFRLDIASGTASEIGDYDLGYDPETEASRYAGGMCQGADGTLWINISAETPKFELPENFDPETQNKYDFYVDSDHTNTWYRLDASGNEISSFEVSGLQEKLELDWIPSGGVIDESGNLYINVNEHIYVVDQQLTVLADIDAKNIWGNLFRLDDGSIAVMDWGDETRGKAIRKIDVAAKGFGEEYPVDTNISGDPLPGGEKYLFTYRNGDALYGYDDASKQSERLFAWSDVDVNSNSVTAMAFLKDGRVAAISQEWEGENKTQLVILNEVDASTLPEKTHLTLAAMFMDYTLKKSVIEFNRKSTTVHIDIKDYSEFNTEDNYEAGVTKLNTEIVAGNVPDILMVQGLPVEQYAAKGLLEDLWPLIENDPDLGRDNLMTRPLEAAETNGILPQIFNSFSITTVVGPSKVVGDRISWTMDDVRTLLKEKPADVRLFPEGTTKGDMLSILMGQSLNDFIDWNTGECRFDSQEFKDILEFCNQFVTEYDWSKVDWETKVDDTTLIQEGKLILRTTGIWDLQSMQMDKALYKGGFSYIGYPAAEGKCGSSFSVGSGIAMSSKCRDQDAAWSFMRTILLDPDAGKTQEELENSAARGDIWGFPINKARFDRMIQEQMTPEYQLDENGKPVLDENGDPIEISQGGWGMDSMMVDMYASSQEDLDRFMELYNAIDQIQNYNTNTSQIIVKEAEAYFKGDKPLDEAAKQIQSRMNIYVNEQK